VEREICNDCNVKRKIDECAKKGDWEELKVGYELNYREVLNSNGGYTRKYYGVHDNKEEYDGKEFVDMAKPRPCAYNSKTDMHGNVIKTVKIKPDITSSTQPDKLLVEYSAITIRQLRAVLANMERRCIPEGWTDYYGVPLTPDTVSLRDINTYIILPFTKDKEISFVGRLPSTAGPQPPRFFVSHWWGEPVKEFVLCLEQANADFEMNNMDYGEQDGSGGGMSADTPVWVCAYANNQWKLGDSITDDPTKSGFYKAMKVAKGRTITILDKEGTVFTRIWCMYELYLTLVHLNDAMWAVYTAHTHKYKIPGDKGTYENRKAVGIISGGSTSDKGDYSLITAREADFPYDLIKKSLGIQIEHAGVSVETDKTHILNSVAGRENIDDVPPTQHESYDTLNNNVRANFAASVIMLQGAAQKGGKEWTEIVTALSKGSMTKISFDFKFGRELGGLDSAQATLLVTNLPLAIENLKIKNSKHGVEFMNSLVQRVGKLNNLKKLWIDNDTLESGEEGGQDDGGKDEGQTADSNLTMMLSTNKTIEELHLYNTDLFRTDNVEMWAKALMQNSTIRRLWLIGVGKEVRDDLTEKTKDRKLELKVGRPIIDQLQAKTKDRTLKLKIRVH